MMGKTALRRGRTILGGLGIVLAVLVAASSEVDAETAWVRGEVRLNLRTGPGTQYRIIGVVLTGEAVQVLQRSDDWTQVQIADGKSGWIPEGYLQPQPPPTVRLEQLERQTAELQAKLEEKTAEAARLAETNSEVSGRDESQREEIERLTLEVYELRAGARWPEWITGASILVVGMIVGAMLHRNATRRPSTRIRI